MFERKRRGTETRWSTSESIPRSNPSAAERFAQFRGRRIDLFRFGLLALAAWTINSLVLSDHGWLRLRDLEATEAQLVNERAQLTERTVALRNELDDPQKEKQEKMAREKYRRGRADEIIYLFDRNAPAPATADSAAPRSSGDEPGKAH
ncbi:MAG: hypothetical protein IT349_16105 [Candidatus Eisenbacteria bacterium]|nr:hypothetical protein [Candidatus Eisenbacteria bacterium]MCC7143624.1 hypothetical protein [Candidatus Eisenbacteria bacterium]